MSKFPTGETRLLKRGQDRVGFSHLRHQIRKSVVWHVSKKGDDLGSSARFSF